MKRVGYLAALSGERRAEAPPALKPPRRLFAHEPALLDDPLWAAEPGASAPAPASPRQAQARPRAPAAAADAEHIQLRRPVVSSHPQSDAELVQRPREPPATHPRTHRSGTHAGREAHRQLEPPTAGADMPVSSTEPLHPRSARRVTGPAGLSNSAEGRTPVAEAAGPSPPPTAHTQGPPTHLDHLGTSSRARQGAGAARDSDPRPRGTAGALRPSPGLRPSTTLEHRSRGLAPSELEPFAGAPRSQAPSRRAPRLHIGKIEVTVTAPVPSTATAAAPPRPQPRPAASRNESASASAIGAPRWFGLAQR
jgi:hypothetical protein